MAKHFRTPEEDSAGSLPQGPVRGNPRARYPQEQQAARNQANPARSQDSNKTPGSDENRGTSEKAPRGRRTLEPLDSFPAYTFPSMDETANPTRQEDSPEEGADQPPRPLPYGSASQAYGQSGRRRRSNQTHRHKHTRRRWPFIAAGVLVVLVVAIGICGALLLNDARSLKSEVATYTSQLEELRTALLSGDGESTSSVAKSLAVTANNMKTKTDSALWSAGALAPIYGSDVAQARQLTTALDNLTSAGIVPAAEELKGHRIQDLIQSGGSVNLDMLTLLSNALSMLKDPLQSTSNTVNQMKPFHVQSIEDTMGKVRDGLSSTDTLVQEASQFLPQLPEMLGANGQTKTYLIVALNNAELRSSGGFPGSSGALWVTDGTPTIGDFTTIAGRRDFITDATEEEMTLVDSGMNDNPGAATASPDFARAASLFAQSWEHYQGTSVDGVIAVDPNFLQSLMKATASSVIVDGVEVNGDNAAKTLMSDTYWRYSSNTEMDAFFAETAAQAFSSILGNIDKVDVFKLAELLQQEGSQRRFQLWFKNADQEALVKSLGMSGSLSTDEERPVLGVFTGDYTWSKMGWYNNTRTTIGEGVRNADGSTTYDVTTTVTNEISEAEAIAAPTYVTGGNPLKRDKGDMISIVLLMAPAGGRISDVQTSGGSAWFKDGTLYGFNMVHVETNDNPQETTTITYKVTTATTAAHAMTLQTTPLARSFE